MRYIETTIGHLREGTIFPGWQDEFDLPDDHPVHLFSDGSVNDSVNGDLLCDEQPGFEMPEDLLPLDAEDLEIMRELEQEDDE